MKRLALVLCLVFSQPALAQDDTPPGEGLNLMEEAMKLFMRGLLQEMEPALNDLRDLVAEIDAYHPPEVLENGDILIRRKTPEELEADPPQEGEIDI